MKLNTKLQWKELCYELGHEEWANIKHTTGRKSRLAKMQREANIQHINPTPTQGFYIIISLEPLYNYPRFDYEKITEGQKYGRLTTIEVVENKGSRSKWKCLCECGNECIIKATQLLSGKTQSCGCLHKENAWGHNNPTIKQKNKEMVSFKENPKLFAKQQRQLMTPALRYKILKRDNFHCCDCGRGVEDGVKLNVDHILPIKKGGKTEEKNLQTLCWDCNIGKGVDTEE